MFWNFVNLSTHPFALFFLTRCRKRDGLFDRDNHDNEVLFISFWLLYTDWLWRRGAAPLPHTHTHIYIYIYILYAGSHNHRLAYKKSHNYQFKFFLNSDIIYENFNSGATFSIRFRDLILTLHHHNNCTTIPHMRVNPNV
jgi:hypothetical protein